MWAFLAPLCAGKIKTFVSFRYGKSALNTMRRLGHWDTFAEVVSAQVDFSEPRLETDTVFSHLHSLTVMLNGTFSKTISEANLLIIAVESSKLLVPT